MWRHGTRVSACVSLPFHHAFWVVLAHAAFGAAEALGLEGPFTAPILESDCLHLEPGQHSNLSGECSHLEPTSTPNTRCSRTLVHFHGLAGMTIRGVEAEWAFVLGQDLAVPCSPSAALTSAAVLQHVDHVVPAVEVVASRVDMGAATPDQAAAARRGTCVIADQGGHGALVSHSGQAMAVADWKARFAEAPAEMVVNGAVQAQGKPSDVLGGPVQALVFMLRHIAAGVGRSALQTTSGAAGQPEAVMFPSGTVFTTGSMTGITPVQWSDAICMRVGGLQVSFTL